MVALTGLYRLVIGGFGGFAASIVWLLISILRFDGILV